MIRQEVDEAKYRTQETWNMKHETWNMEHGTLCCGLIIKYINNNNNNKIENCNRRCVCAIFNIYMHTLQITPRTDRTES